MNNTLRDLPGTDSGLELTYTIEHKQSAYAVFKRVLDVIGCLILMVVILPFIGVLAAIVKLTSPGPAFFMQERLGEQAKPFKIYKLRTMVVNAHERQKHGPVLNSSPLVTPFGRFLRRTKLDELPQIFNVLKGDMSFIGPRPILPKFYDSLHPWEMGRFFAKPGLSGLTQVSGGIFLEREEKSVYDVRYVKEMSFSLDCSIFLKTIKVILFGEEKYIRHLAVPVNMESEAGRPVKEKMVV